MKKIFGVSLFALMLTACGGGGSESSNNSTSDNNGGQGSVTHADPMGLYSGNTNLGQSVVGLVDKNNKFWFLYSPPYTSGITGTVIGNFTVNGTTLKATNGKEFYYGGSTVLNTTIDAVVEPKKSLNGKITSTPSNQITFETEYDLTLNKEMSSLQSIAGAYNGESAIVQGIENANLTISNTGILTGKGQSGCSYSGKITTEQNTPYYNINLVFGNSPCYMAGQEVKGVAYYDSSDKSLYAIAENGNRENAVLFLGSKY